MQGSYESMHSTSLARSARRWGCILPETVLYKASSEFCTVPVNSYTRSGSFSLRNCIPFSSLRRTCSQCPIHSPCARFLYLSLFDLSVGADLFFLQSRLIQWRLAMRLSALSPRLVRTSVARINPIRILRVTDPRRFSSAP